ncbi:hypothetical protein JTB14_027578 [Gonioctena quinquepunctata]|nr:hypothetical protein JTB14_027578 [Gonioctena quinquepunctata]
MSESILENFTCDSCHKFLSVLPVKLYSGGKKKCGRCSMKNDGGVVSLYGDIAEKFSFPCVNRYDGCKELLTPPQVADHEKNCESKTYICPICPVTVNIPTFLMIGHFQELHREALLKVPIFHINLKKCPQTRKWFLYDSGEKLFFITWNFGGYSLFCNAWYLGKTNGMEKITQKLIIHHANDDSSTGMRLCHPYSDSDDVEFIVSRTSLNKFESLVASLQLKVTQVDISHESMEAPLTEPGFKMKRNASLLKLALENKFAYGSDNFNVTNISDLPFFGKTYSSEENMDYSETFTEKSNISNSQTLEPHY